MRVYLAGPIFQCEDSECINWRQEIKKRLNGFKTIDPMERDYRGVTDENYKKIVEDDKALIDSCDIIIGEPFKTQRRHLHGNTICLGEKQKGFNHIK